MKPVKNHIFCLGCNRPKIAFESKEKANNFIKFNSSEILEQTGKAPIRSYFCTFCSSWHVTSNKSTVAGEKLDYRDAHLISKLTSFERTKQSFKSLMATFISRLEEVEIELILCDFNKAEGLLELCDLDIYEMDKLNCYKDKVKKAQQRIDKVHNELVFYSEIYNNPNLESNFLEIKQGKTPKIRRYLDNIMKIKKLHSFFENRETLIRCDDSLLVDELIENAKELVVTIKCSEKRYNIVHSRLLYMINTIEDERHNYHSVNNHNNI